MKEKSEKRDYSVDCKDDGYHCMSDGGSVSGPHKNYNDATEAGEHWIQGAVKKPGALHAEMGIPQGKKIPKAKLDKAAKAGGKLGQRARFAENVRK